MAEGADDDAAAYCDERACLADDETITRTDDDRLLQAKLCIVALGWRELVAIQQCRFGNHLGRTRVKADFGQVLERLCSPRQQRQVGLEQIDGPEVARRRDGVASIRQIGLELRDIQGHTFACTALVRVRAVHLHVPDPSRAPAGKMFDLIARQDPAADRYARDHRAESVRRESSFDGQAEYAVDRLRADLRQHLVERVVEFIEPLGGDVGDGREWSAFQKGAGYEFASVLLGQFEMFGIDEISLGQYHQPVPDPQEGNDVQVLACLRHHAVVGGDHEDHQIDAGSSGHHVLNESLVPGNIDDAHDAIIAHGAWGKAQIDR